jgi:hypothetical protein
MAPELCAEIKADGRQVTHVGVTVRTRSCFTQVKPTAKLLDRPVDRRGGGTGGVGAPRSIVPYGCSVCG